MKITRLAPREIILGAVRRPVLPTHSSEAFGRATERQPDHDPRPDDRHRDDPS